MAAAALMRVLVMSDIHANLPALQAVLADAQDAYDTVWCLGDVVGYGPNPNECAETVRALPSTSTPRLPHFGPAPNFLLLRANFLRGSTRARRAVASH